MKTAQSPARRISVNNHFRPAWTYQRMPACDAMLAEGRGLSPAFFRLLEAVEPERPVSFDELGLLFPRLQADDLELWLAELCRMSLIAPATHERAQLPAATTLRPPGPPVQEQMVRATQVLAQGAAPAPQAKVADCAPLARVVALNPVTQGAVSASIAPKSQALVSTPPPTPPAGFSAPPRTAAPEPMRELAAREPFDIGVAWKNLSVEALYNELLAICAELDAREPNQMGALAGALAR